MCQLKIAPCGRVDLNGFFFEFPLRWPQERQFAFLCDVEIVDQRTHGRDFSAGKRREGVERFDAKQRTDAFFGPSAVKTRA